MCLQAVYRPLPRLLPRRPARMVAMGPVPMVAILAVSLGALVGCGASFDSGVQVGLLGQETGTGALPDAAAAKPDAAGEVSARHAEASKSEVPKATGRTTTLESELNAGTGKSEAPASANKQSATPNAEIARNLSNETTSSVQVARIADTFTAATTPGNHAYKIGPQDVLEVSVFKVPELSRSVQVADIGTINLPLVGEVEAVGKTSRDLEQELATKLGDKYIQSPQVTVYVKEFNSRRVTVDGAIKKPGIYPIRGKTTLVQIIATAEGPTDVSDTSSVVVFRNVDGKRSVGKFDLGQIRDGQAEDPIIQEGDMIVVSESAPKTAFQSILKALPLTSVLVPLL